MSQYFRLGGPLIVLLFLLSAQVARADTPPAPPSQHTIKVDLKAPLQTLSPKSIYQKTTREVVSALGEHYSHLAFDNALSKRLLTQYLKTLDPNRVLFLQSDIDGFDKFASQLDDQLANGKLTAGYRVFNVYQKRAKQRIIYLLGLLDHGIDKLDFDSDASVLLDRSKADWADGHKAIQTLWRERLTNTVIGMRLDDVDDNEITERLTRRYRNQLKRLHQTKTEDVFSIYLNALCALYDPHTDYFTPERLKSFNIDMSHSLEGIGAVLQSSDGYTKIVRLVPGGPAASSGLLKPGDRILAVGQGDTKKMTDIVGWRLDEVVKLIRGPKDSTVRLEVMPSTATSEHTTHVITITRDKIKLEKQAAKKKIITLKSHGHDFKVGVITLPAFYQDFDAYRRGDPNYTSSYRDVKKLVTELQKQHIDGLVMDLRNNGGGSLFEAIRLVSLFVDGGPTVQIRAANGKVRVENDVYPGELYHGPMAVLVNRFSASASEIFTGAMQDYGRALVIGGQTYGKGTVQTLLNLDYGDIKLTRAKFYRVSGSSNQLKGIIPDISLPFVIDKKDIGESTNPNALPWDHIASAEYTPMFNFGPYLDELVSEHKQRVATTPDFVYAREMKQLLLKNKQRKTLSLNEKKRTALHKELNADTLAITNQRRKAQGKKPVSSMEELDEERGLDDTAATSNDTKADTDKVAKKAEKTAKKSDKKTDKDDKPDAYLDETGKVLGDLVALMKQRHLDPADNWK